MKSLTKKSVYILCLISVLCNLIEISLYAINIPAALAANCAMVFFCIGMLFYMTLYKSTKLVYPSCVAMLCSLFATLNVVFRIGLIAWPLFSVTTLRHEKRLVVNCSIAVIIMGAVMLASSFFQLPALAAICIPALSSITNAIYCIVMIKDKEIIAND